jgi:hypothetical protein
MIERLVVEYPTDEFDVSNILIGGVPIRYGGQIVECITVKLVGAAAALGSVTNTPAPMTGPGYVDPADARQVFNRGRGEPLRGLVRAFVGEAGELESSARAATPATRSRRLAYERTHQGFPRACRACSRGRGHSGHSGARVLQAAPDPDRIAIRAN